MSDLILINKSFTNGETVLFSSVTTEQQYMATDLSVHAMRKQCPPPLSLRVFPKCFYIANLLFSVS